mmetsp:Transcript_1363/g.2942  ORF Transcript_1363/g.2942 Transcript_1363/m.2942 type:complete len:383 (+) Transcript_1363:270-1418(+)
MVVLPGHVEWGPPLLVLDAQVRPAVHERLRDSLVPELGSVVQRSVPENVLDVGVNLALLEEVRHDVDVPPERGLVQRCAAGGSLELVHVGLAALVDLLQRQQRPVHRQLAELHAEDILGVLGRVGLEGVAVLGAAEAEELGVGDSEVVEEGALVARVHRRVLPELGVGLEGHVGGEHAELAGAHVLELRLPVPLLRPPLLVDEELEVAVVELERRVRPGSVEPAPHLMHASEGVTTRQSHNVLVSQAHAVEDISEMLGSLGSVGEAAVGRALAVVWEVCAPELERDLWASEELDRAARSDGPQIRKGDLGVVLLHRKKQVPDDGESLVRLVVCLRREADGAALAASCFVILVEGARGMPRHPHSDRAGVRLLRDQGPPDLTL